MGVFPRHRGLPIALGVCCACGCMLQTAGQGTTDEQRDAEDARAADGRRDGEAHPGEIVATTEDGGGEDEAGEATSDDAATGDGCVPELCNGLDDDCDGTADNGPGMRCALGTGSPCGPCGLGRQSCTETCTWSACVSPEDACEPGAREDCVPEGCATGFRECVPGCVWGECVPYHTDCTAGMTRNCSVDRCGDGRQTCGDDCTWGGCAVACSPSRYTCCPGVGCVDLNWNDDHCGTCDTNCELFSVCLDGHCT